MRRQISFLLSSVLLAIALPLASCVNVDPKTGKTIPRGTQRYEFGEVVGQVDKLKDGMSKLDCLLLLGSPAEKDRFGDVWVYLPERPAVIIPGRALRLEFENNRLVEHGFHAIVLGKQL